MQNLTSEIGSKRTVLKKMNDKISAQDKKDAEQRSEISEANKDLEAKQEDADERIKKAEESEAKASTV